MSKAREDKSKMETEKRVDALLKQLSERRKESIKRSMARPLRLEVLRSGFIVGCMLLDIILVPSVLATLFGGTWCFVVLPVLIPLFYVELKVHEKWFPTLSKASATSVDAGKGRPE